MITTLDKPEEDFRREVVAFLDGYGPVGGSSTTKATTRCGSETCTAPSDNGVGCR